MSRVRLVPIALIVVLSLAVLFGVWRLYLQFSLINPLVSKIATVPGVSLAKVESENPPAIKVTLKPNNDLQTTYLAILSRVNDSGNSNVHINIDNSTSNTHLWRVFESLGPIIDKGEKQGDFPSMITAAEKQAAMEGAKAIVTMDVAQNIYVQISEENHHFYQVVTPH